MINGQIMGLSPGFLTHFTALVPKLGSVLESANLEQPSIPSVSWTVGFN